MQTASIDSGLVQLLVFVASLALIFRLGYSLYSWFRRIDPGQRSLIDSINSVLPQTQCGRCGYPGCRPYARAIARGEQINRCPPGGEITIIRLSNLLNDPVSPLAEGLGGFTDPAVARIREDECIGCTKCIQACPVDAILGASRQMHTVIVSECTGCDLCVEPCPVDCIDMIRVDSPQPEHWRFPGAMEAKRSRSPA